MRLSSSLFYIIFLMSACQNNEDKSEIQEEITSAEKYHSIVRDDECKIIQTYSKDGAFEYNIRTEYLYDLVDGLQKKIIKNVYQDSITVDSVVYSYEITDTLNKNLSVRYTNGEIISKTSTIDIQKNNELIGRNVYISSYNKYKGYSDTIKFISTYNYLEDKLHSIEESGKYLSTSETFYYDNDLLKRKVLLDVMEQDTLRTVDFFYKDSHIFKTIAVDNRAESELTSIYSKDGFLMESFWRGSNNEHDTVTIKFIDSDNKIEYHWNGDYYPLFLLEVAE